MGIDSAPKPIKRETTSAAAENALAPTTFAEIQRLEGEAPNNYMVAHELATIRSAFKKGAEGPIAASREKHGLTDYFKLSDLVAEALMHTPDLDGDPARVTQAHVDAAFEQVMNQPVDADVFAIALSDRNTAAFAGVGKELPNHYQDAFSNTVYKKTGGILAKVTDDVLAAAAREWRDGE